MDKTTAAKTDNALTLAFEKAATTEEKQFHPWRYFVAGGETLAKINEVIADFAKVEQERADFTKKLGAKRYNGTYGIEFDFKSEDMQELTGKERVDYNLQGGSGGQPFGGKRIPSIPDFVVTDGRAYGQFHPDVATERGREIRDEMMAIEEKAQPMVRFAKWLGAYGLQIPRDPKYSGDKGYLSAKAVKVGNDWLVAVPVEIKADPYPAKTYSEEWVTPPGSAAISVSDYFSRVEKANLLTSAPKP